MEGTRCWKRGSGEGGNLRKAEVARAAEGGAQEAGGGAQAAGQGQVAGGGVRQLRAGSGS
jgi:hypothetical protein